MGDANVDLILAGLEGPVSRGREVVAGRMALTLGGSAAIVAVGAARLGARVDFVGVLGRDPFGDFLARVLETEGVGLRHLRRDARLPTGVTVALSGSRDRAFVTHPGTLHSLSPQDVPHELLRSGRHLHLASFFLLKRLRGGVAPLLRAARDAGCTTSLDPGWDPAGTFSGLAACLPHLDVFLPNEAEAMRLTGARTAAAAAAQLSREVPMVVVKRGRRGALLRRGSRVESAVAFRRRPVDTTGAGDSFDAGFLVAWLTGAPIEEALRAGAACGALSTRALGGTAAQPTAAELLELLRRRASGGARPGRA